MLQIVSFNIGGARGMRPAPHDHEKLAVDTYSTLQQVINPRQPTVIAFQESGVAMLNGNSRNVGRQNGSIARLRLYRCLLARSHHVRPSAS